MLVNHFNDFKRVAKELKYFWILVRITNINSLDYIGKADYAPKRIDCKAKTADRDYHPSYKVKGLVVNPRQHLGAFDVKKQEKISQLQSDWDKMNIRKVYIPNSDETSLEFPNTSGYTENINKKHKHFGCLLFNGKYIHGDYDLYDIVDIRQPNRNLALVGKLHGENHFAGANLYTVQRAINTRLGLEMIQHGGEAQYQLHSDQEIDAFGPNWEYRRIRSLFELHSFYKKALKGRITLADSFPKPAPNNIKRGDPFGIIKGGKK